MIRSLDFPIVACRQSLLLLINNIVLLATLEVVGSATGVMVVEDCLRAV